MQSLMSIDCNDEIRVSDITFSKDALRLQLGKLKLDIQTEQKALPEESKVPVIEMNKVAVLHTMEDDE